MKLLKLALKRFNRTIRLGLRKIYLGLRNDLEYVKLISQLKLHKYVPQYVKRSWGEHEQIRLHIRVNQNRCPHLKGGRYRGGALKDHNVFDHTYIDGSRVIGCMTCRKKWTPKSHDWDLALNMAEQSSNRSSSSERPAGLVKIDAEGKRTVHPISS